MRAANEFIRHQTSSQNRSKKHQHQIIEKKQEPIANNKIIDKSTVGNLKPSPKQVDGEQHKTNRITPTKGTPMTSVAATAPILSQKQQQQTYNDEMLSSPSDSSGSGSECEHQHSGSHHLHSYQQPQR